MPQFQTKMFCPHIYFCHHFLAEFLDNCCYPAGGGLLCQRSDTRRGDGSDEGNAGPLTYDYTSISRLLVQRDLEWGDSTWDLACAAKSFLCFTSGVQKRER